MVKSGAVACGLQKTFYPKEDEKPAIAEPPSLSSPEPQAGRASGPIGFRSRMMEFRFTAQGVSVLRFVPLVSTSAELADDHLGPSCRRGLSALPHS